MNETSSSSQSPVLLLHAGRAGARRGVVSDVFSETRGGSLVGSGAASEDSTEGGTLSLSKWVGFANRQKNFPGLLAQQSPKKMRAVVQKLRRVRRHMFFCALPDGFWLRPFLKSTSTDFGGGGGRR
jgi:hypothetical protein